ncbi:MAG: IS630 family transposase [Deltaproteobacteria bacterium]|nr:IS630 family transposase [Deltaproteobacteria bacterium]
MRIAQPIELSEKEIKTLTSWSRGRRTPTRLMKRAKIVLMAARGQQDKTIAELLGIDPRQASRWRRRFIEQRLVGIERDAARGGRNAKKRERMAPLIIERTTQSKPGNATHWSVRTLAESLGIDKSMVHRVWHASGLKPHLSKTFKVSRDKRFVEKVIDVVGLYLNPPEHALVLCADEKTSVQALDRTQPGLPLVKGRLGTMTHDYKRNGTTTLFAALEMTQGSVIGTCMSRHRHQEWIKFLTLIDQKTPADLDLHLIMDNYATHKHPKVKAWLKRHKRFHPHFVPTSSSWLNMVERWFRDLTDKRIRRGVFKSVADLIAAIKSYIEHHNSNPIPFVWTAKAEDIIAKYRRAQAVLDKLQTA